MTRPGGLDRPWRGLLLVLLFLLALGARSLNLAQVATPGGLLFFGVDPYYHVRRSLLTARSYPRVPRQDFYAGYPRGMESHFAPLWDLMVATVARIDPLERPRAPWIHSELEARVHFWSAWLPPLLGAATVLALTLGLTLVIAPAYALGAGVLLALMPAHVDYTLLGRADHHALESLFSTLAVVAYLGLLSGRLRRARLWVGLALGAHLLSSAQGILFLGLIAGHAALEVWRDPAGSTLGRAMLAVLAWMSLLTAAGLLLCAPYQLGRLAYDRPSSYHLLAGLFVALVFLFLEARGKEQRALQFVLGWAALAVAGLLLAPTWEGLRFVGRGTDWIGDVADASPLLRAGGAWNLAWPNGQLGWLWLGLPAGWWFLGRRTHDPPGRFLLLFSGAMFLLSLYQVRFLYFLAVALVALAMWGLCELLRGRVRASWAAGAILLVVLLQFPALSALWSRRHLVSIDPDVLATCLWLGKETPETRFFEEPGRFPGYGVLTHWDLGNQVILLGRRPAVATASHQANMEGIRESIRFFLAGSEAEGLAILDRNRARYVLTESRVGDFNREAPLVGKEGPYSLVRWEGGRRVTTLTRAYRESLYARLHLEDGRAVDGLPALSHFRLLYESPRAEAGFFGVHHAKLFERVRGALISGRGLPGEEVQARGEVVTPAARRFAVLFSGRVNARGIFSLRFPYSSDPAPHRSHLVGPATVSLGDRSWRVSIPERAVLNGATVPLPHAGR